MQICTRLSDLLDQVVLDLYEAALVDLWPAGCDELRSQVTLVAHGGFGRRDVAPYSDVDLMILHAPEAAEDVVPLVRRLMHDLYDAGLELGQSVRTPDQACQLASEDAAVCTSLMESRLLGGSDKLYKAFVERFARRVKSRSKSLFKSIEDARRVERRQYGETVYLLEPNIKRSRGGLRDMQFLRWLGFLCYSTTDFDELQLLGALSKEDQRTVRDATEFLLRLRNELHFHAGKSSDVLVKAEQVRLAPLYGHEGTEGLLPVEQFMGEYFRHTRAVRSVVSNFVSRERPGQAVARVFGTIFSHQVDGDYRVTPTQIVATKSGIVKLRANLSEVLRLCDLANLHDKRIAQSTWETVRKAMPQLGNDVSPDDCEKFLSLVTQPNRLGELLRRLHELGVLEKIIPGFKHARCLLQFNEYHKYTVDEHCILAVERATEFWADTGVLGRVYRGIKNKRILHLALLIHDLGKGFVEDHSEVGLRIAGDTALRLGLPPRDAETLKFLVHKHLLMSHLAFWRDTSDDEMVVKFAVEVGSPEVLDMLFVLTAADFAAVGPGVWNSWKSEVVARLYKRAMEHLAGGSPAVDTAERVERQREAVRKKLGADAGQPWYARQIDALPASYVLQAPSERIAAELRDLCSLKPGDVHAAGRYVPESRTVEFVVGTFEDITPGVFHKLTGALATQRLQIHSAEINTLADALVLDRFYVSDPDFAEAPPQHRLDEVAAALIKALQAPHGTAPSFRSTWQSEASRASAELSQMPTRVQIDNSTSEVYTIIDVFASDRIGLLYTITRTLFELSLSVSLAKIGTYLDQVVDVFYVTDQSGGKITDEYRIHEIRSRMFEAIDAMGRE